MDIFTWAQNTMGSVYAKLVSIDTIAAVLFAVICLIWKQVSSNPKSVEICNTWLKRIVITWVTINVLGFIMTYFQGAVKNGQYVVSSSSAMIMPFLGF